LPLGAQPLTATVTCAEALDVTNSVTVPLALVDKTGPDLVFSPPLPAGNALSVSSGADGTAHVPFSGTVSDPQSGVASLTSAPGGAIPLAADGNWSAPLPLPLGTQQVTFAATDNAGNTTTVAVMVTVVPEVSPPGPELNSGAQSALGGMKATSGVA